jgi:hypothetical protein
VPRPPLWLFLAITLPACAELRGTEGSTVSTSQVVASAYWFRGVPRSLQAVTQGDLQVDTPLATGGTLSFVTWYNLQLTNRTGDATFPDGQGGQNTEIDLLLDYTQTFGRTRLSAGGIAYQLPQVGPSTKEAYLTGAVEALGISNALSIYYDVDRIDDFYFSYEASRGFTFDEQWSAALAVLLGYMREGQAADYFGKEHAGFSDLLLTGTLNYHFDANTSVFLKVAGVTVPDDELSDALEQNDLENSGMWFVLGAAWGL